MQTYERLLGVLRKRDDQVLAIYPYGSHVYGTNVEGSDEDFITVLKYMPERHQIIERENLSFVIHDQTSLQRGIWAHEPYALETYFLPKERHIKHIPWDFRYNAHALREAFSQKASHAFVKAKKKIDVERDFKRGKKSLFHSLRILNFGIQIATKGKIVDYQAANDHWWEIWTNPSDKWEDYIKVYRPIYNGLCTDFRKVCPK